MTDRSSSLANEESAPTDAMFTPITLGALALRNRIVMAPMTRSRASADGVPSPLAIDYYGDRADAGLLIAEGTQPSEEGQGYCRTPGIHTDAQVAAWRRVTERVHARGGLIALQIMHVGRVGHPLNQPHRVGFVAPSAIAVNGLMFTDQEGRVPMATPRAMSTDDIRRVVRDHASAARRAREAGFDAVELHGANGYLGNQFLSTQSNRREDAYGGSAENRVRFVLETLDAMIEAIGSDRVALRLSPGGTVNDVADDDPMLTYRTLFASLGARRLAYLHVQQSGWDGLDALLAGSTPAPLVLTGGLDPASAAAALKKGASAVGFARHFIANPDLPARIRNGWPLAAPDPSTFFTPGPAGYVDQPRYTASA